MNSKRPENLQARRRVWQQSHCEGLERRTLLSLAFGSSVMTNVPDLYRGAQTANINGDSDDDVVVGTQTGATGQELTGTAILLSNGNGSFTPTSNPPAMPSSSGTVNPFIVGDFTSDSQADILYLTEDNSGSSTNGDLAITPEINNDDNPTTFTAGTVTDVPPQSGSSFNPLAVVSGHFTADGNLDLAVLGALSGGGQELVILEGNDTGTFEPIPLAPFTFPSDGFNGGDELVAGNFMGTGNLDIAVYDSTTGAADIIQNEGTSTFQQLAPVTLASSTYTIDGATIAAGDFNEDGATDLVVSDNVGTDDAIDVYLSNSNGTFEPAMSVNDGNLKSGTDFNGSIATGDFNNDGHTDVADDFGVLLGDGTGALAAPVPGLALGSETGTEFAAIAVGDFDGDGIPDLAGISLTGNGFEAALNTTPQTTATSVLSSNDTSPLGDSVTFTATITITSTNGTPTGTVTFLDGTTSLGSAPLVSNGGENTATFTTSSLTSGVHSITASYSGDASFGASVSSPASQTITETTTSTLATSNASVNSGAVATFTDTVAPSTPGGAVPTGTVSFLNGSTDIGDVQLNGSGVAIFGTASLPVGVSDITAEYSGDTAYATSNSNSVSQTVIGQPTGAANLVPTITAAKLPVFGVIGDKINAGVPITITNQGQATAKGKITINVYVSTNPNLDSTAQLLVPLSKNVSVAAGKSVKFTAALGTLPKTLSNGSYYVLVQVLDPSGFGNTTTSTETISLSTPFISFEEQFTGLTLAGTVVGNTKTKGAATLEISNFGNVPAVGLTTIQLYTSTDLQLDSSDALITTAKVNLNIPTEKTHTVKIPLGMIPNVASGGYYVLAQITDPDKQMTQAATFGTVQIDAGVVSLSATISAISPGTIKPGSTGTMTVSLTNNGTVPSNGPMSIVIGVSSDGFTQAATLATVSSGVSVKVGATVTLHLKFKIPTTQAAGTFAPTVTITDAAKDSSGLIIGTTPLIIS